MKRLCVWLTVLLLLSAFPFSAAAKSAVFSLECGDAVDSDRLFSVSVSSDVPISAATFSLRFDADFADFREAKAADDCFVETNDSENEVKLAFASLSSKQGALMTLTFKSLCAGEFDLVLEAEDACDETPRIISVSGDTLSICVNGKSLTASSKQRDAASSSKTAKKTKTPRATTSLSDAGEEGDGKEALNETESPGAVAPMVSPKDPSASLWKKIAIAACAVLLVALLFFLGFFFGKRAKTEKDSEEKPDEDAFDISEVIPDFLDEPPIRPDSDDDPD